MEDYEYILDDPSTFKVYQPPTLKGVLISRGDVLKKTDEFGNVVYELVFARTHTEGHANLRLIWAATHKEPRDGELKLKYHHLTSHARWPVGRLVLPSGLECVVAEDLAPPRWIVENYVPGAQAERGKRATGHPVYDYYWMCATAPRPGFSQGKYRAFDSDILEVVRGMWWGDMDQDEREAEMMRVESQKKTEKEKQEKEDNTWERRKELALSVN